MSRLLASLRRRAALATLAAPLVGAPAAATLVVYEPFDYEPGVTLDGVPANALGLAGDYTATGVLAVQELVIRSPGLDYGDLSNVPAPLANRLSQANGVTAGDAVAGLAQPLATGAGTETYWSALFTLDDSTNGNRRASILFEDDATGDLISFGEPAVGVGAILISTTTLAAPAGVSSGADDAFVDGRTVLLVGRYLNSAASDGDRLDLLVYDTPDSDALPDAFDPADPGAEFVFTIDGLDIDMAQITSLTFTIRGTDNNFIDELRLGTDYASVVPEPATSTLLLAGLAGFAARRRRALPAQRPRSSSARARRGATMR